MSHENLAIVWAIHEALARGESPVPLGLLSPDIEYVNPPDAVEPGTRQGIAGYEDALRSMREAFQSIRIEVRDIKEAGDEIVVLATFIARGSGSGIQRQHEDGFVWTVRDGKAVRFQWFNDPAKALKAVGLSE